jgi:hypothetical protein
MLTGTDRGAINLQPTKMHPRPTMHRGQQRVKNYCSVQCTEAAIERLKTILYSVERQTDNANLDVTSLAAAVARSEILFYSLF